MESKFDPIITLSTENSKPGTPSWISTCKTVREAMEEFGFFIAVHHGYKLISSAELEMIMSTAVFAPVKEFFNLPEKTKRLNTSETFGFGYSGERPDNPLHETMGIGDSTTLQEVQSFAHLMWPYGNDHFCKTIHCYTKQVSEMGQMVTRMIFESYGVGKYCDSHIDSTSYLFRANSYRVAKVNETNLGIRPHTDTSFMTILKQDEVQGLEVQCSKDGSWIPVNLPPSSFAIMAGDALMAWSNGRIKPCFHRVIMSAGKARLSVGLFSFHKGTVQIPEELADDHDNLLRFNSFDHFGLLKFRAKNPTLSSEERVNAYCGIKDSPLPTE